jgi:hypothetical protein
MVVGVAVAARAVLLPEDWSGSRWGVGGFDECPRDAL